MMRLPIKFRGWLSAALVVFVWGITFANTRALLVDFSALEIQVLRFSMAYAALCTLGGYGRIRHRDEWLFAGMGFFGVFMYQLLENCAIYYTNASNVAILVSFVPIVTAMLARIFTKDRELTLLVVIGSLVAIGGVVLVSADGVASLQLRLGGDIMAFAAMVCWGFYSVLVSKANSMGYPPLAVIRRAFFWALMMMVPLCTFGMTPMGASVLDGSLAVTVDLAVNYRRFANPLNWMNLCFLGLLASAACFVMWSFSCRILGVVRTTIGLYLIPVIGAIFAVLALGERLTVVSVIGGVIIIVGVVIATGNAEGTDGKRDQSNKA